MCVHLRKLRIFVNTLLVVHLSREVGGKAYVDGLHARMQVYVQTILLVLRRT